MNGLPIRPSRLWYLVAGVLLAVAVGCAVLAVSSLSALSNKVSSFQRVQVPGQRVVTFASSGSYLVYFEGPGFSGLHTTGTVPVGIQSQGSHQQIKISALNGTTSESYSMGGHSGLAVASFTITAPGTYVLNAGQPTGSPAPADIAVGPRIVSNVAIGVVGIIAGILALIGSILAWLLTLLLRVRSRRRLLTVGPMGPLPAAPFGAQFPGAAAPQPPYGQYPGQTAAPVQYPGPAAQQKQYPGQTVPPVEYPDSTIPPAPGSQPPYS